MKDESLKLKTPLFPDTDNKICAHKKGINNIEIEVTDSDTNIHPRTCFHRYFGPIKAGSLRGAIFSMASITFGVGCLASPSAVSKCGPIIALLIFIFVGIITYYTLSLLVINGMKTKIYDFYQLVEKTMGSKKLLFSNINNLIICIGCIIAYQITVYQCV